MKLQFVGLALWAAGAIAQGQTPIRGPMLGFVWDSRQETLRPVLGIAGSSTLGKGIPLDFAVKQAAISPNQDFAVVLGGDSKAPYFVDLRPVDPVARRLDGLAEGASKVMLSSRGSVAAFAYEGAKKISVVGGLPGGPNILRELDLSVEGLPPVMTVSDDGALVLAAYPAGRAVLVIDENGNRTPVPLDAATAAAAFLEGSRDAVIASDQGVTLLTGLPANASSRLLRPGSSVKAVSSSSDGKRILLADMDLGTVVEAVIETGAERAVECPCTPSAVTRISAGVFRLNEVSRSPLWLLEVQESGLRTLFVPPDAADEPPPSEP